MGKYRDVRVEIDGDVGIVVLARSATHNALDHEIMSDLCDAIDEVAGDDRVAAVILAAEGRHFSVGASFDFLEWLQTAPAADVETKIYSLFQGAVRRLFRCPKPTIAAIDGAVVTVGCELALSCDFRIVTPRASFQESWIRLGLLPALGGMFLLPRIIGTGRANEMILRGKPIGGEEAVRIGLASEVVDADDLRPRAIALAKELAALPARAYAAAKRGIQNGHDGTLENAWSSAVLAQAIMMQTDDFKEGVRALREKRAPVFAGR